MKPTFDSDTEKWAFDSFCGSTVPDKRLVKRLIHYARGQADEPCSSTSASVRGDLAKREGAFRFLENSRVLPTDIEQGPFGATSRRCHGRERILLVQDTTTVSVASKTLREELV
ncbi:MAG: hypothetical protein EOO38_14670 [Cytophagaceae bacterium]|nr:MAG: hypothetical protein EOO38_14670 [Cytophagaceae bacterium]